MSLIDRIRNYVVAAKDKVVDSVHNYMELRRARKVVRQWEALPEFVERGGVSYFNEEKYLVSHKVCDAILFDAIDRAVWN
jgi:hypothetical protein